MAHYTIKTTTKEKKMIEVIKLTDSDGYTRRGQKDETQWTVGDKKTLPAKAHPKLYSGGVYHVYLDSYVAVFVNPNHANIPNPIAFRCSVPSLAVFDGLKAGVFKIRVTASCALPEITPAARAHAAILIAQELCGDWQGKDKWWGWAKEWLSGENRKGGAAAARAAEAAARAAAARAAEAAAWAAEAAAWAAETAARAAGAAWAAETASLASEGKAARRDPQRFSHAVSEIIQRAMRAEDLVTASKTLPRRRNGQ